jgi:hypothetical protein
MPNIDTILAYAVKPWPFATGGLASPDSLVVRTQSQRAGLGVHWLGKSFKPFAECILKRKTSHRYFAEGMVGLCEFFMQALHVSPTSCVAGDLGNNEAPRIRPGCLGLQNIESILEATSKGFVRADCRQGLPVSISTATVPTALSPGQYEYHRELLLADR